MTIILCVNGIPVLCKNRHDDNITFYALTCLFYNVPSFWKLVIILKE